MIKAPKRTEEESDAGAPGGRTDARRAPRESTADGSERSAVAPRILPDGTADDDDPHNLVARYVETQRLFLPDALSELRDGYKTGCWMWFVFPTPPYVVDGVERGSSMNQRYALRSDAAGLAYLRLPPLRDNYVTALRAVVDQLEGGNSLANLFGPSDDAKALSSFTLFERLSGMAEDLELNGLCKRVSSLLENKRRSKKKKKKRSKLFAGGYTHSV